MFFFLEYLKTKLQWKQTLSSYVIMLHVHCIWLLCLLSMNYDPTSWQTVLFFSSYVYIITLNPLMWKISWALNNASRWQMGFNVGFKGIIGKPEGKKPLGRPRDGWENNVKMGLRELWWEGIDCSHLAVDRDKWQDVVNTVMSIWVP